MLRSTRFLLNSRSTLFAKRFIQITPRLSQTEGEKRIADLIRTSHLKPTEIEVKDISGGCGSMYEVFVVSKEFKGKRIVQQHRIVNEILKEEVKLMHGLRINTEVPEGS